MKPSTILNQRCPVEEVTGSGRRLAQLWSVAFSIRIDANVVPDLQVATTASTVICVAKGLKTCHEVNLNRDLCFDNTCATFCHVFISKGAAVSVSSVEQFWNRSYKQLVLRWLCSMWCDFLWDLFQIALNCYVVCICLLLKNSDVALGSMYQDPHYSCMWSNVLPMINAEMLWTAATSQTPDVICGRWLESVFFGQSCARCNNCGSHGVMLN